MTDFNIDEFYLNLQNDINELKLLSEEQIKTAPYPGLRKFKTSEFQLFFGREGKEQALINKLNDSNFLAVIGSSGSGKSSLVRAGLVPKLYGGYIKQNTDWRIAICHPGENPIKNLAIALARARFGTSEAEFKNNVSIIDEEISRDPFGLTKIQEQIDANSQFDTNLLVIVDQFEEIFRYQKEHNDAIGRANLQQFINLLLEATSIPQSKVYVIITMRSEYLGDCVSFSGLPEAINSGQYLVPRLTRHEIKQAIIGPLALIDVDISPRLLRQLVNSIGDNMDQLPLLQHALMRTYQQWKYKNDGHIIDVDDYQEVGQIESSLSAHASSLYLTLGNKTDEVSKKQLVAQLIFKRLTDQTIDGRGIRNPTVLDDIYQLCMPVGATTEEVDEVINVFRADNVSILSPPSEVTLKIDTIIDISHESIMRNWPMLESWMETEAKDLNSLKKVNNERINFDDDPTDKIGESLLSELDNWTKKAGVSKEWASRYTPLIKDFGNASADNFFDKNLGFLKASKKIYHREKKWSRVRRFTYFMIPIIFLSLLYLYQLELENAKIQQNLQLELENAKIQQNLQLELENAKIQQNLQLELENAKFKQILELESRRNDRLIDSLRAIALSSFYKDKFEDQQWFIAIDQDTAIIETLVASSHDPMIYQNMYEAFYLAGTAINLESEDRNISILFAQFATQRSTDTLVTNILNDILSRSYKYENVMYSDNEILDLSIVDDTIYFITNDFLIRKEILSSIQDTLFSASLNQSIQAMSNSGQYLAVVNYTKEYSPSSLKLLDVDNDNLIYLDSLDDYDDIECAFFNNTDKPILISSFNSSQLIRYDLISDSIRIKMQDIYITQPSISYDNLFLRDKSDDTYYSILTNNDDIVEQIDSEDVYDKYHVRREDHAVIGYHFDKIPNSFLAIGQEYSEFTEIISTVDSTQSVSLYPYKYSYNSNSYFSDKWVITQYSEIYNYSLYLWSIEPELITPEELNSSSTFEQGALFNSILEYCINYISLSGTDEELLSILLSQIAASETYHDLNIKSLINLAHKLYQHGYNDDAIKILNLLSIHDVIRFDNLFISSCIYFSDDKHQEITEIINFYNSSAPPFVIPILQIFNKKYSEAQASLDQLIVKDKKNSLIYDAIELYIGQKLNISNTEGKIKIHERFSQSRLIDNNYSGYVAFFVACYYADKAESTESEENKSLALDYLNIAAFTDFAHADWIDSFDEFTILEEDELEDLKERIMQNVNYGYGLILDED